MAELSTGQVNDLPDSDFAYIEPGGLKDSTGRTVPRSKRHFPINDAAHVRDALARAPQSPFGPEAIANIRAAAKRLGVEVAKFEQVVALWKDEAEQLVYGVALTPGMEDSQGDVCDAADIQKAAHRFLAQYRAHDVQHSERAAGVETVESFIAPADMEIAGEKVLKGAWVLVTHVSDPGVWERVRKGQLTGYSIGGSGVRDYS